VEDSISENFEAVTSNSNVDLMGVNGDKINVSNKNGRINFGYIIGKDINIDAVNSVIEIRQIKTTNIMPLPGTEEYLLKMYTTIMTTRI